MQVDGVLETCVYASDLIASERFYVDVVGLAVYSREPGRHVFFRCGQGMFLVFNPERTATGQTLDGVAFPSHGTSGAGHVAFRVPPGAMPDWKRWLSQHGVPIEAEVEWPGGGHSLYVRDPAGNSIELATALLWGVQ